MKKHLLIIISFAVSVPHIACTEVQSSRLKDVTIFEQKSEKQWNKTHIARNLSFATIKGVLCFANFVLMGIVKDKIQKFCYLLTGLVLLAGTFNRLNNAYEGASSMVVVSREEVTNPEIKQQMLDVIDNSDEANQNFIVLQ